jgi:hypothetical protein
MSWSDIDDVRDDLERALTAYDWMRAGGICDRLIRRAQRDDEPCPLRGALEILSALRRKRRFELIAPVAEAFTLSGQDAPEVRRLYAQSLIDRGLLLAPEPILHALSTGPLTEGNQVAEAHGLLGRLFKQRYVAMQGGGNRHARLFFERALSEYLQTYRLDPEAHYWHGINVVALVHRGRADGIPVRHMPDPDDLARDILDAVARTSTSPDPFALATRTEAFLALGDYQRAEEAALEYSRHPAADAFEVGSTLRQLEEIWRLTDTEPPGSTLLPILRAGRMRAEAGAVQAAPAEVDREIAKVHEARSQLEKVFGSDKTVTLQWYETGLSRTKSVARVERLSGKGHGTGWLVDAKDFFPGRTGRLLLTNAHVINATGSGGALTPDQARANFQGLKSVFEFDDAIVWSSPPEELDATFLAFRDGAPDAEPLPLASRKVRLTVPPPRIYIIGHPAGRDVELSLHDNKLLGSNERLLHYRTPTEGGSSGSPVFEEAAWKVVGLHHAGGWYQGLDGQTPPEYEANEGIPILAIQEATRRAASPPD